MKTKESLELKEFRAFLIFIFRRVFRCNKGAAIFDKGMVIKHE